MRFMVLLGNKTMSRLCVIAAAVFCSAVLCSCSRKYVYEPVVPGKLYRLDDSPYLVQEPHAPDDFTYDLYDRQGLDDVTFPKFLYFINTSVSTDFSDMHRYDAFAYVKKQFRMTKYAELSFRSFDEYKRYFYQTDHHWNYRGSYRGYVRIMRMMEGRGVKLLRPCGTMTYDTVYNGSYSRDYGLRDATEKFTVYEFRIPSHRTFVNGREREYGVRYRYVSADDCPSMTYSNHYGLYYGDDYASVVYKFDNPDAESLLILATSFSNAVNDLIASHYKETHVLDVRHYEDWYGRPLDVQKYMEDNHLDKLLVMGDLGSLGHLKKKG
jgi:hypothetical protein